MRVLYAVVVLVAIAATSCKRRNERQVGTLPPPPSLPQVDGGLVGVPSVGAPRGLAAANRAFERLAHLLRVAADTASTSDGEFDFANDDLDTYRAVTHAFASLPPGLPRTFRETTEGAK